MNKRAISLIMGGMLVVSNLGLSFADEETLIDDRLDEVVEEETLIDDRLDEVVEEEVIKQFICRHCGEPYNVSDYHQCDLAMVTCADCGKVYNAYDYHQCDFTKITCEDCYKVFNFGDYHQCDLAEEELPQDEHENIVEDDESWWEEESCEDCGKVNCECVYEGDENYTDTPCEDCGEDLCECEDDDIENVKKEYDKKLEETKKKYDKKLKEVVADKENVKEVVNAPTKSNDKTYKTTSAKSTSYSSDKVDNPKTSDMGVISAIGGLVTALGGLIFTRKH